MKIIIIKQINAYKKNKKKQKLFTNTLKEIDLIKQKKFIKETTNIKGYELFRIYEHIDKILITYENENILDECIEKLYDTIPPNKKMTNLKEDYLYPFLNNFMFLFKKKSINFIFRITYFIMIIEIFYKTYTYTTDIKKKK